MSQVNPNSIEEMEVITAGAGVEFSRAQGGFARIIQKQGSNEFEGVFEFYYRSSKLDGDGAGDYSNLPDLGFDWYQPSVQVSGPIVKDKLWYRLSHEMIEAARTRSTSVSGIEHHDGQPGHSLRPDHLAGLAAEQAGLPVPVRPVGDRQLRHQLADPDGVGPTTASGTARPTR